MLDQIMPIVFDAVDSILGIVIVAVCVKYVCPFLTKIMQDWLVKRAVQAAEQIYIDSGVGEKKKEYVITMLEKVGVLERDERGNIPKYWDMLIESAVKAMNLVEGQIIFTGDPLDKEEEKEV